MLTKNQIEAVTAKIKARLHHIYETHDHVAISSSCGKDSAVITEIAAIVGKERNIRPKVFFFDQELIGTWTIEYAARQVKRQDIHFHWFCAPVKVLSSWSKEGHWIAWGEGGGWIRRKPKGAVPQWPEWHTSKTPLLHFRQASREWAVHQMPDTSAVVMGIRRQESMARRAWKQQLTDGFYYPINSPTEPYARAHIIYDISEEEVWSMIRHYEWDWNRQYLWKYRSGLNHALRIGNIGGEETSADIHTIQVDDPKLWNRAVRRLPYIMELARYGQSAILGRGAKTDAGEPTAELIMAELAKLPPDRREPTLRAMWEYAANAVAMHLPIDMRKLLRMAKRGDSLSKRLCMTASMDTQKKAIHSGKWIWHTTAIDIDRRIAKMKHAIRYQTSSRFDESKAPPS